MSGRHWSKADTDKLIAMHQSKMTVIQIANAMELSICQVRGRLTRLGYVGGKKARRLADKRVKKPRAACGRSWESKLFLPWPEWREWKQEQRRMQNVEV